MEGIAVMCAAFGLTVSGAKTAIMCSTTKGMPESTVIFSLEAARQVYNQTNNFVHREVRYIICYSCRGGCFKSNEHRGCFNVFRACSSFSKFKFYDIFCRFYGLPFSDYF